MATTGNTALVKDGDHVMLKKENNLRLFQISKGRDIWLEKSKFKLDGMIGQPYGSLFEVKDGDMVRIERQLLVDGEKNDQAEGVGVEGKDNRHLLDQDSNQKLTQEEIEQMKKEGVSGDHLIEQLIENSATFQSKTGYAQQKWVKKKKKKHLLQFTVLKPTTRLLCEMQWSKGPSRISNLRIDTLGQILTTGNVRAGSTVMVVDSCMGLVTGAVLERLGGFGKVVSFYHGDSPMKTTLENYDFPSEILDTLYQFPLEKVNSLKIKQNTNGQSKNTEEKEGNSIDIESKLQENITAVESENVRMECDNSEGISSANKRPQENIKDAIFYADDLVTTKKGVKGANDKKHAENKEHKNEKEHLDHKKPAEDKEHEKGNEHVHDKEHEDKKEQADTDRTGPKGKGSKPHRRGSKRPKKDRKEAQEQRAMEIERARDVILQGNVDCLIVATKFHPTPIVLSLVDYMAASRQVVVFSQFKEALQDCYVYLREKNGLVNYRLTETWLRDYQVLANRTHPVIQMSGTGGYLLTATTIVQRPT